MDDDDYMSASGASDDAIDSSDFDKQKAYLQTFIDSLPYKCETVDEMLKCLEQIVSKIVLCAKARNWIVLTTWDGLLQCWLMLRYPMTKSTRAKLIKLYYELITLPGTEARIIRSWADMISRLIVNKQGLRPKLESADLTLDWQPLWRVLQKDLWPKKRLQESSRNIVNLLLFAAEECRRYYPAEDIPNMLATFIPLTTKDSVMTMVPVMASFLPPTGADLYLPTIFALWEGFNSNVLDDRFLHLAGELSEEQSVGVGRVAEFKDVGIWSEMQWTKLVGKCLTSMHVPVGGSGVAGSTSAYADLHGDKQSLRIKKNCNRSLALAKIIIHSMYVDGPERSSDKDASSSRRVGDQAGYLAGSKALDSLFKLITCTESFFHPSNSGPWSSLLNAFIHYLTSEFCRRIQEESQPSCETPKERRLTPAIRREFVNALKTPALLAMFSKDPLSMSCSQYALRAMSYLEPEIMMPELLERAYGGLEVVNETHRTTAALSLLYVIPRPLVTEKIWMGGPKHVVPLLELCLPGIDLNDPGKTVCATMFIVVVVQHLRLGDVSLHPTGLPLDSEAPGDVMMEIDNDDTRLPDGVDIGDTPRLNREDERALTRDGTASFADWVASLFRRVFALFENLPEEGGKRNMTGGKSEETMLKSIKSMLDVVCLHLSDQLFDLVLNLVYNYATTNAKANAVRAFGQLVACLARAKPEQTIAKFLPFCISQIEEELKHGASSIRTTSSHSAVPSDTTLHWNLSILRGCLGYGGPNLLQYKAQITSIITLLVDKTKSERGYSSAGRLITRVLHTLVGVYPINSRFVNSDEWEDPKFAANHNLHWGKLYDAKDVTVEWHTPSRDEISFAIEIIEAVGVKLMDELDGLLEDTNKWDNVARNDFCRYLHACKAVWNGLPTFIQERDKECPNPLLYEGTELAELLVSSLTVNAGFTLTDPQDPLYQQVFGHRTRFGRLLKRASTALRQKTQGEDHIDAIIGVARSIDSYLLDYGMTRGTYDTLHKGYVQAREANRMWPKQRQNSRLVFVKRAQVYHSARVYMHALYRRRSALDDELMGELVELSLSPYTRIRRHAQSILHSVCGYYLRSTRFILSPAFDALAKGNDPDRMKGALYVLGNKGTMAYALADQLAHGRYLLSLLECQHEEKPSVQKLVNKTAQDVLEHLTEEAVHTEAFTVEHLRLDDAIRDLEAEFSPEFMEETFLAEAKRVTQTYRSSRGSAYQQTLSSILSIASRPQTHWRYVQMALRYIHGLLSRDVPASAELATFLLKHTVNPQPTIRAIAQKAIIKLLVMIKIRTYSSSPEELWLDEWKSPLRIDLSITDPSAFLAKLQEPISGSESTPYIDKIPTGFLTWAPQTKAYKAVTGDQAPFTWEADAQPCLAAMRTTLTKGDYFKGLAQLWGQESGRPGGDAELRSENVTLIKSLAKMFEHECLDELLAVADPLITDTDKYKQRAGAELVAGVLRGSKHWPGPLSERLWAWVVARLDRIYAQIKPDTLNIWESAFNYQMADRDFRRSMPLVNWILGISLDFSGDSAFDMSKALSIFAIVVDTMDIRFNPMSDKYVNLFLENANNGYAEIRSHIADLLSTMAKSRWEPSYPSSDAFLQACKESDDPLRIREAPYFDRIKVIIDRLPALRSQRLPPPYVSQSEYDKIGLTLLQWLWNSAYGAQACLAIPYAIAMMPEMLQMSELSDSTDLQTYSTAVLYVLSALAPSRGDVQRILDIFVTAIKSSTSWRIRLHALPALIVFFYRNLLTITTSDVSRVMDMLLDCLADENVEVRVMASKTLSGIVRTSQRQSIVPLKNRFVRLTRQTKLPQRSDPTYAAKLRSLHSAILGLCALVESFPYSVEPWMPPLAEVLAPHSTDPPPISTTIRKCASEFKKTHQDTWHKDQTAFNEDQLQSLSTMLVGTSYYA
ncbi:hypothetical protein HGRIS_007566 [Hohenbuehelia grisea]|uniref:Proteasome activator subunit 4 n=1 Tax=Hohenbuehelia grisea TaxID=104357 RepID=A0ABR3J611_9AGAR